MTKIQYRLTTLVLLTVVVAGLIFRAWPLIYDCPIWLDESFTWRTLQTAKWHQYFSGQAHRDHPSLSYILVAISRGIFGTTNTWSLRLPSLLCGVLCIPLAFHLGTIIYSRGLGLCLSVLIAFDPTAIHQSQQARMYSLYLLVLLITLTVSVDVFRHDNPRLPDLKRLGICLGILGWTHQLMIPVWLAFALALSFHAWYINRNLDRQQRWQEMFRLNRRVFFVASLVNLPNLIQLSLRLLKGRGSGQSLFQAANNIYECFQQFVGSGWVGMLVCLLIVIGLWQLYQHVNRTIAVLLGALIVMILLIQIPLLKHHHFLAKRYMLGVLPAIYIGLCLPALMKESHKIVRALGLLVVVGFVAGKVSESYALTFVERDSRYQAGAVAEYITTHRRDDEYVISYPSYYSWIVKYYHSLSRKRQHLLEPIAQSYLEYDFSSLRPDSGAWFLIKCSKLVDSQSRETCYNSIHQLMMKLDQPMTVDQIVDLPAQGYIVLHVSRSGVEAWQVESVGAYDYRLVSLQSSYSQQLSE